ncbi:MAG: hypothetical protein ACREKB_16545 [Candidatus Rokuibacteriota bacterium]
MTTSSAPLAALLVLAGCGSSFTATLTAAPAAPVPDVFRCARSQLEALGYRQSSIDVDEHRVTARRIDQSVQRPDVTFRRAIDQIEIEVTSSASGEASLTIQAKTLAEHVTRAGFVLELEPASDGVKAAAQSVLQVCGT